MTKHGHKRVGKASPEYITWLKMKERCYRKKCKDYPGWGGKGIRVCDQWLHDFEQFLADMGPKPSRSHSIDRWNSKKDYSKDNCRWATPKQQASENRDGLIPISVGTLHFKNTADACRHFGLRQTTVNYRLHAGIPIELAFSNSRLKSRRTRKSYLRKARRLKNKRPAKMRNRDPYGFKLKPLNKTG